MIRQLENGVRVVELGKGTTFVSQVLISDNNLSSGIAFTNKNDDGTIGEESVIIEITNEEGVNSYINAIFDLIQSWENSDKCIDNKVEDHKVIHLRDYITKDINNIGELPNDKRS